MNSVNTPTELLEAAYRYLDFSQGKLLSASAHPQTETVEDWVDKGDWQALAAQVGAEAIFFVDRDPVVVFAKSEDSSPTVIRKLYEQIWCMARPQLLFLALRGELIVYDLTKAPPRPNEDINARDRLIDIAYSIADVQTRLAKYHRERIETGVLFGEERFRNSINRADRALIRDLKTVRQQLAAVTIGQRRP